MKHKQFRTRGKIRLTKCPKWVHYGHMDRGGKSRTIQIPGWMNKVISELAMDHKQSFEREIVSLVEAAIKNCDESETGKPAADLQ